MNMNCSQWRDAILLRAADELGPEGRVALEHHLAVCPACRADAAAWRLLALEARAATRQAEFGGAPPAALALGRVRAASTATAVATALTALTTAAVAGDGTGDGALPLGAGGARRFRGPLRWTPSHLLPGILAIAACAALLLWLADPPGWTVTLPRAVEAPSEPGPRSAGSGGELPAPDSHAARRTVALGHRQTAAAAEPRPGAGPGVIRAALAPAAAARGGTGTYRGAASVTDRPPSKAYALGSAPPALLASPALLAPPARLAPATEAPAPANDADEARPYRRTPTARPEPARPTPFPTEPASAPDPPETRQPTRTGMARITGRVEDPSGLPVFMALVYLRPAQASKGWGMVLTDTDHGGAFAVDLPPGRWELWVEAAGLPPWRYQEEPVLDLGGQDERSGILLRLPESPISPPLSTPPPPTGTSPAAAPYRIAPILSPTVPTSPLPNPIEPEEWMP